MQKTCPYVTANWLSKLTLWWLNPLMWKGHRRTLTEADIYDVPPWEKSRDLTDSVLREWKEEHRKDRSLFRVFLYLCRKSLVIWGIFLCIVEVSKLVQPVLIGYVVRYLQGSESVSQRDSYLSAAGLLLCFIFYSCPYTVYHHIMFTLSMRGRTACTALVYKKVLTLKLKSLHEHTTGQIINLLGSDVEIVNQGVRHFNILWMAPLQLIIVFTLLFVEFGYAFLAGFVTIIILFVLLVLAGVAVGKNRAEVAKWTDKRNGVMNDVLTGIQMIKMFCWEEPFSQMISDRRRKELSTLSRGFRIESQISLTYYACGKLVSFVIVVTTVLMDKYITLDKILILLGWMEIVRTLNFGLLPMSIIAVSEMYYAMQRIQKFLECEDKLLVNQSQGSEPGTRSIIELKDIETKSDNETKVLLENVSSEWITPVSAGKKGAGTESDLLPEEGRTGSQTDCHFQLNNISMEIKRGELVAIVGEVGSGKTSLLMSMLGEMSMVSGKVSTFGSVAYVPQEAWVMSGTIRENILLDKEHEPQHYQDVLEACALSQDLVEMPLNDLTFVGEHGWTLSGGQKIRVNLARAANADADLLLLDDPLSAVDTKVGKHIFDRCICDLMKKKTRVLVTHQLQYLPEVDRIFILHSGAVVACGTYPEVQNTAAFARISVKPKALRSKQVSQSNLRQEIEKYAMESGFEETEVGPHSPKAKFQREHGEKKDGPQEETNISIRRAVDWKLWLNYVKASNRPLSVVVVLIAVFLTQVFAVVIDSLFVKWSGLRDKENIGHNLTYSGFDWLVETDTKFLCVGGICSVILLAASEIWLLTFYSVTVQSGKTLHMEMFKRVVKARFMFFETTPLGRILNRFTRDTSFMDVKFPRDLCVALSLSLQLIAMLIFIVVVNYWLAIAAIPLVILMIVLRQYVMATVRDLRRLDATTRTPIYTILMDTIHGLPQLRAMAKESHFEARFHKDQDRNTSVWFLYFNCFRWLGLRIEWLLTVLLVISLMVAINIGSLGENGDLQGLGLVYMSLILLTLQYVLRFTTELESEMISIERICEYRELEQEAAESSDVVPPTEWPTRGQISIEQLSLSYGEDDRKALKDIDLEIKPGKKIGLVGRSGAGKSSLMKAILRLVEPSGSICIDGIDITKLGLNDLRRNISVIPQDPILLCGTLRKNLDPFNDYTDDKLWNILEQVDMKEAVSKMKGALYNEVSESGSNFSVGQKQLLCLARAILRRHKVLLVDEGTANVDNRTDAMVQRTIRERFRGSTVLTIAHRLHTVMDCDKVLVMSEGTVAEFDHPHVLFQKKQSLLNQLAEQTGPSQRQALESIARASYLQKSSADLGSGGSTSRRSVSEMESVSEEVRSKETIVEKEETQDESEDDKDDDEVFVS